MNTPRVIVITGPTATGKSALGVLVAKKLDGEIVSADSMQVYKYMDIGTAKPKPDDMCGIPHHLIDFLPPQVDYCVAEYVKDASSCIDDIFRRNKQPILVGGTGLYIDSLLSGRNFSARGDDKIRKELEVEFDKVGGEKMLQKLREVDSARADELHANNKRRIIRALEVFITSGKPISEHDKETQAIPSRYRSLKFALNYNDRAELYRRIDCRVDEMVSKGLEAEVRLLLKMGVTEKNTSLQAIGYKEFSNFLSGKSDDIFDAIDLIKMESRRYAKRQLTWLRRDNDIKWITWDKTPDMDTGATQLMELFNETK